MLGDVVVQLGVWLPRYTPDLRTCDAHLLPPPLMTSWMAKHLINVENPHDELVKPS